jgi:hypothetical protein
MVHSSMSPHLAFESTSLPIPRPPASPAISIAYTLPFLEYFQPIDSQPFAHSSEKHGGIPPSFPFRNSPLSRPTKFTRLQRGHNDEHAQYGVRRPRAAFHQPDHTKIPRFAHYLAPRAPYIHLARTASVADSRPIHNPAIILRRTRLSLDNSKSSANIPMLSV